MKNVIYKINKWFEINVGWFFVNGQKVDWYANYLKEKYNEKLG
jgi:hypothetical protein